MNLAFHSDFAVYRGATVQNGTYCVCDSTQTELLCSSAYRMFELSVCVGTCYRFR